MTDPTPPQLDLTAIDPAALRDPRALHQCAQHLLNTTLQQMARAAGDIAWSKLPDSQQHTRDREQYIARTAREFLASIDDEDRESLQQHILRELERVRG